MSRRYAPRHAAPVPARRRTVPIAVAAVALTLGAAAQVDSAQAAAPARFTMHEHVDHSVESYTFTASGGGLCASGTFVDRVTVVATNHAASTAVWRVDTTYTCADGSGTFTAVKRLVRRQAPDTASNKGPVRFTGGTGTYARLSGHGMDVGASRAGVGDGTITGRIRLR